MRRAGGRKFFVTIWRWRQSEHVTMKTLKLIPLLTLIASFASAQGIQQMPAEQAEKIARRVTETLGSVSDAPFNVDADVTKSAGIKGGGDAGLLAIPDRKLTPDAVANAGKSGIAVGQLWMRKVVPAVNSAAPDAAKLRTVTVSDGDQQAKVEVYFLGVAKSDAGTLELGIFAKDKEQPLVKVPLVKTDAPSNSTPIALDGHKDGENSAVLVVAVFGSYKADVMVTRPRE